MLRFMQTWNMQKKGVRKAVANYLFQSIAGGSGPTRNFKVPNAWTKGQIVKNYILESRSGISCCWHWITRHCFLHVVNSGWEREVRSKIRAVDYFYLRVIHKEWDGKFAGVLLMHACPQTFCSWCSMNSNISGKNSKNSRSWVGLIEWLAVLEWMEWYGSNFVKMWDISRPGTCGRRWWEKKFGSWSRFPKKNPKRMSMPAVWREFSKFRIPDRFNLVLAPTIPKLTSRNPAHSAGVHCDSY